MLFCSIGEFHKEGFELLCLEINYLQLFNFAASS